MYINLYNQIYQFQLELHLLLFTELLKILSTIMIKLVIFLSYKSEIDRSSKLFSLKNLLGR